MKAVILAAGLGTRLRPSTEFMPKCLTRVHGHTILDYQLAAMKKCGITEVAMVIGHCGEKLRAYAAEHDLSLTFIENENYAETNNAHSLWRARDWLLDSPDGFLVFNSDLIFQHELLQTLLDSDKPDAIVIDTNPDMESDQVKIEMNGDRIYDMRKDLPAEKTVAEAVGPVKFSPAGGAQYLDFIADELTNWLFYTMSDYAKKHDFYGVKNPGYLWAEIDTNEDHTVAADIIPADFMDTLQ